MKGGIKGIGYMVGLGRVLPLLLPRKDKGLMDKDLERYGSCISSPELSPKFKIYISRFVFLV